MLKIIAVFCLAMLSWQASATQMICNTGSIMYTLVAWDDQTKVATLKDTFGVAQPGKIVAVRPHGQNGGKVYNLQFNFNNKIIKDATAELVIFSENNLDYRAFGGISKVVDGQKLLTFDLGNNPIYCGNL